jgi:hypothetical protein
MLVPCSFRNSASGLVIILQSSWRVDCILVRFSRQQVVAAHDAFYADKMMDSTVNLPPPSDSKITNLV